MITKHESDCLTVGELIQLLKMADENDMVKFDPTGAGENSLRHFYGVKITRTSRELLIENTNPTTVGAKLEYIENNL